MPDTSPPAPARSKRADAQRNEQTLLAAAAATFVTSGVDAPIREIAAAAGVGVATIYRHFPTRADLVVAVYRHQVQACAEAGPQLLADLDSPVAALRQWADLYVDFLVTKHGLKMELSCFQTAYHHLAEEIYEEKAALLPGCKDLLSEIQAQGVPLALVSSCIFSAERGSNCSITGSCFIVLTNLL